MSDRGAIPVELLTATELLDVPEPLWLIEKHIHQQEVGAFWGAPNGGKTFVALDWALSVAAGVPWLDEFPTTQAPVLYMAGEGAPSLQKRVEAWMVAKGVSDVPIYFQCRPLPILEDWVVDEIRDALDAIEVEEGVSPGVRPGLIIVDTLSQFMMGGDENGPDMAILVSRLRQLSQEANCAALVIHHTNATGARERGNSSLRGNTDVMFEVVSSHKEGLLDVIELRNDKMRDDPRAKPVTMKVHQCERSLVLSLGNSTLVSPGVTALTSESLVDLLLVSGTIEDTDKEIVSVTEWQSACTFNRRTFYRHLHKLLNLKLVKPAGRGSYKLTPQGRETLFYYQRHRDK